MLQKLVGQTAIYGVSSILTRLLNYMLTPYLTRIMTTEEYGVIVDLYALIPFILVMLTMGLETGYFRFAGKAESDSERRNVFSSTWSSVIIIAILFLGAVVMFTPQIASLMLYAEHPSYIWLTAAIVALDAITAMPFARLRQQGKAKQYVMLRLLSVILNIAMVVFFYSLLPTLATHSSWAQSIYDPTYGAGYYLIANLITSFGILIVLYPSYSDTKLQIRWAVLLPVLVYSFPLLISGIAGTANQFIDRQMIKYLMPESIAQEALGIYGAVAKIGVILLLFVQMYRFAAEPFFLANFKKEDFLRANAEALKYFSLVSVGIFIFIMLYVNLFGLLVGADFRVGLNILPIILVANIFSGMTLNLNFWYKQTEQTRYAILVTGVGLILTFLLSIALIPTLGYVGAAWARLGCETAMLLLSYYYNRKHYPTPYNIRRMAEYFLIGGVIYAVSLTTGSLPVLLMYTVHTIMLALFVLFAIHKEQIPVKRLILSIFKISPK